MSQSLRANNPETGKDEPEIEPSYLPEVTILVTHWNGDVRCLSDCLMSIRQLDYPEYQVIVLDHSSTDDSKASRHQKFPEIEFIEKERCVSFGTGLNVVLKQTSSSYVAFLRSDMVVLRDWLKMLILPLVGDETVGITGAKLLSPDKKLILHAGAKLTYPLAEMRHRHYREANLMQSEEPQQVEFVISAAMAARSDLLTEIGLFDEWFHPYYYADADWCYRAREADFKIVHIPKAVAVCKDAESFVHRIPDAQHVAFHLNRLLFVLKHHTIDQFLHDFIPAEISHLERPMSASELDALRSAYLNAMLSCSVIIGLHKQGAVIDEYRSALTRLREKSVIVRPSLPPQDDEGGLQDELADRNKIRELQFNSATPLIGSLIARFRQAWNNVAGKWYVRSIIQQQQVFNASAGRVLLEQDSRGKSNASDIGRLASELADASSQLTELMCDIDQDLVDLDRRLTLIEQRLIEGQIGAGAKE